MTPSTVHSWEDNSTSTSQDKEEKITSAQSFTTKSQIIKLILVMFSSGVTGTMAAMVLARTRRYLNLTVAFNMATLGLRKNFMEMTTKSTLPMEPMEQWDLLLAK